MDLYDECEGEGEGEDEQIVDAALADVGELGESLELVDFLQQEGGHDGGA